MRNIPLILMLAAACGERPAETGSEVLIDSGIMIDERSANKVLAIHWIGNCTSTIVSDNTLITAAHCVDDSVSYDGRVNQPLCIQSAPYQGTCTSNVRLNPRYMQKGDPNHMAADIAVAVFPRNTFKHHFLMRTNNTGIGEKMLLVGYSREKLHQGATSSKRWGGVQVSQFSEQTTIISQYRGNSSGVAVSPGDSGGPMFDGQCRIIGVASRMAGQNNYAVKFSMHANLTDMGNQKWMVGLQSQMDAYYCGATGTDPTRCLTANQFNWQPQGPNDFPCTQGGGNSGTVPDSSGGTTNPDLNKPLGK